YAHDRILAGLAEAGLLPRARRRGEPGAVLPRGARGGFAAAFCRERGVLGARHLEAAEGERARDRHLVARILAAALPAVLVDGRAHLELARAQRDQLRAGCAVAQGTRTHRRAARERGAQQRAAERARVGNQASRPRSVASSVGTTPSSSSLRGANEPKSS